MSASRDSRETSSVSWRTLAKKEGLIQEKPQVGTRKLTKNSSVPTSKNPSGYRLAGYIRLSPSDEIREEGSLISHPQRIEDFVKFKNSQTPHWGEVVEWYVDKDLSGKDMNRPAFRKMCKDIKEGSITAVIATEIGRLSRNVKDFMQFWDFLKFHRVKLFSLKENFDTSSPMGELMIVQAIGFAQFERQNIVARIKDGARARAERGLSNGGPRPLGYDNDPDHRCRVLVNESEKPYVHFIFEKFKELGTLSKLETFLNENGYRTKSYVSKQKRQIGGKRWTVTSLYGVLTNLAFIGKREIHKRNRLIKPCEAKEGDEYRVVDAHWPGIVDPKLFSDVQHLLETNRQFSRPYVHDYRLTGLIVCSDCGEPMVGKSGAGSNGKYFYYGHMRKKTTFNDRHLLRCPAENISAPLLEEAVISRLCELAKDKNLITELAKSSHGESNSRLTHIESLIASKEQQLRKYRENMDSLLTALSDAMGEFGKKAIHEKIESMGQQIALADNEIAELKSDKSSLSSNVIVLDDAFQLFSI